VARAKTITLATARFKLTHQGSKTLLLKLTKAGKKLLRKDYGRLKAIAKLSVRSAGKTIRSSYPVEITPKTKSRSKKSEMPTTRRRTGGPRDAEGARTRCCRRPPPTAEKPSTGLASSLSG
jgi:hypothetical protein